MSVAHPHCSSFAQSATWLDSAAPTHLLLLPLQPLLVTAVYKIPRGRLALTCFGFLAPRPDAEALALTASLPSGVRALLSPFLILGPWGGHPTREAGPSFPAPATERKYFSGTSYHGSQRWQPDILWTTASRWFLQSQVRLIPYCVGKKAPVFVAFAPCLC